ncbi:MAG: hypothetical protein F4Y24_02395 [Gemmatimonadetes bacterium]|nr:hypothetical protein [Gemmatimonadota bacterium]MYG24093.1 hypothetical protein [Gemmatimonadota bacterium]MYJ39006.1 hypothetical protein [Gemmatimonadota bacterium]
MRDPKTKAKLLLAVHTLNQTAVYTKNMIAFEGDFPHDVELALCLYEKPGGGFEFTIADNPPPPEIPEPPEFDDVPRPVTTVELKDTVTLSVSRLVLPALPPTLPEDPTAEERWEYLLDILKQKAAD